jgi:hypothetical protein
MATMRPVIVGLGELKEVLKAVELTSLVQRKFLSGVH